MLLKTGERRLTTRLNTGTLRHEVVPAGRLDCVLLGRRWLLRKRGACKKAYDAGGDNMFLARMPVRRLGNASLVALAAFGSLLVIGTLLRNCDPGQRLTS